MEKHCEEVTQCRHTTSGNSINRWKGEIATQTTLHLEDTRKRSSFNLSDSLDKVSPDERGSERAKYGREEVLKACCQWSQTNCCCCCQSRLLAFLKKSQHTFFLSFLLIWADLSSLPHPLLSFLSAYFNSNNTNMCFKKVIRKSEMESWIA